MDDFALLKKRYLQVSPMFHSPSVGKVIYVSYVIKLAWDWVGVHVASLQIPSIDALVANVAEIAAALVECAVIPMGTCRSWTSYALLMLSLSH